MLIYLLYAVTYSEIAFSSLSFGVWGCFFLVICFRLVLIFWIVLSDNRKHQVRDLWGPFSLLQPKSFYPKH